MSLYGHDCPNCVDLSEVHRPHSISPLVWIIICITLYAISWKFQLTFVTYSLLIVTGIALYETIFLVTHCSRFVIALDDDGHLHIHQQDKTPTMVKLLIVIKAGLWPRHCRLYGDRNAEKWTVKADRNYLYFADEEGAILPVRYGVMIPASSTRLPYYSPLIESRLPIVMQLITYSRFVYTIQQRALEQFSLENHEATPINSSHE